MNVRKLKEAERRFLIKYPGGFLHPELQAIGKKHAMSRRIAYAQEAFAKDRFKQPQQIVDSAITLISQSSVVSLFEKPKFRDYLRTLSGEERQAFVDHLKALLHGDLAKGFEGLVAVLRRGKIAKWPILTAFLIYYRPDSEVFIKPTTAKNVIAFFELDALHYSPTPSYAFYRDFRDSLLAMKAKVSPDLAPSNAAFSGFLMMSTRPE